MSGKTSRHNLPYPTAGDPIHEGAAQIQALAEAVDAEIGSGGAGGGSTTPEATSAVPNTLVKRDDAGRTQVADPAAAADAATKGWTESRGYATTGYVDSAIAAAEIGGGDDGGGGSTTPEATSAVPNTLVKRDDAGRTQVADPAAAADAATKEYVDTTVTGAGYITSAALQPYATRAWVTDELDHVEPELPADVLRASDLGPLRAELFGGANRTVAPFCEIRLSYGGFQQGGADILVNNAWSAVVDTDNAWTRSTSDNYYRCPVAGRYRINYQIFCDADNASSSGALKVLRNGRDVLKNSITSRTGTASLEGPTMSLTTDYKFNAGDQIRFAYWYNVQVHMIPVGFGNAYTKASIQYVGSK